MATKKKSTTTKAPAKKSAPKTRKAAPKKRQSRRSLLRSHVGLQAEQTEFMTFRITKQTLYWLVLGAVVILFTVWLTQLQADIQSLYDQIDANNTESSLVE